ncbi:N-acetylmuramoyl-L-alanine amidase [Isoptericola aurantiacus]|uniref:N-acetylmuramoyl-L-alanine amidase n=1 Tax=Isoptericola aurantiacus TaxID=3377839 RepID=UPI00383AE900
MVLPTVTLPVAEAHAVPPEVEALDVEGVDRSAEARADSLDAAVGSEQEGPDHAAAGRGVEEPDGEAVEEARAETAEELAALSPMEFTQEFLVAGVTWAAGPDEVNEVAVRLREDGEWTEWRALGLDGVVVEDGRTGTEPVTTSGADGIQVRVLTASGAAPEALRVDVVDPGTSGADATVGESPSPAASADAATGREIVPNIVTRSQWGADESLRGSWPEVSGRLDAIFVHHTAGTNSYSKSQSAAIVRGIYAYHTKSRGWPDIGYQFLVDRFGRIFQGRSGAVHDNPIGAQVGGYNTGTIGVSVMGDYETARPSSQVMHSLMRVIAWKAYRYGIGAKSHVMLPTGSSTGSTTRADPGEWVRVPAITTHRTTNYTACPGQHLQSQMRALRTAVGNKVKRAKSYYGTVRPAVGKPRGQAPAGQVPAQWSPTVTYRWSAVSGAKKYQVLHRYAGLNDDMPNSRYWRVYGTTTNTSVRIKTSAGTTRQVAVRAIGKNGERGKIERIMRSSRPVHPNNWDRSNAWKRTTGAKYHTGLSFRASSKNASIVFRGAREVKSVRIVASTSSGSGRIQVRVKGHPFGRINLKSEKFNPKKTFVIKIPNSKDGEVRIRTLDGKPVRISSIAIARR